MFHHGAFGGATKRFTYLFSYLNKKYPGNFYYIINRHFFQQLKEVFGDLDFSNIRTIDADGAVSNAVKNIYLEKTRYYADYIPDPLETDKNSSYPRKIYWYYKNMFRQKKLFRQIEKLRKDLDIKVFIGIYSGVLPLTFYSSQFPGKTAVIFSDMDSYFIDVHRDMDKLWYRKYYSFNYALENADAVDFLSQYILNGIKERGINLDEKRAYISPCSFADYSRCISGNKSNFEVAFASRLEPEKNPIMFLQAASIINREFPQVKFHLLGEGTLAFEVEKYIYENNLKETVNFCFHKNPPEVFKNTSIFVSLQSGTNYPSQSILEAMACGNAIVASNTGDTNLFINNNNGLLINLNTNELTAALKYLITDKDKTVKLGKAAERYVRENHTIEKFTDYYLDLITKVYENKIIHSG